MQKNHTKTRSSQSGRTDFQESVSTSHEAVSLRKECDYSWACNTWNCLLHIKVEIFPYTYPRLHLLYISKDLFPYYLKVHRSMPSHVVLDCLQQKGLKINSPMNCILKSYVLLQDQSKEVIKTNKEGSHHTTRKLHGHFPYMSSCLWLNFSRGRQGQQQEMLLKSDTKAIKDKHNCFNDIL